MAKEKFRPKRQETSTPEEENLKKLEERAQIQAMAEGRLEPPRVQGPIPPEFQQIMEKNQAERREEDPGQPTRPSRQRNIPRDESQIDTSANEQYQNLLRHIQEQKAQYEAVDLPSQGKFYDGTDGPSDGRIHLRRMTGKEEEILATTRFVRKGQAMNMIFNNCIQEDYDASQFLTEDRTYLLIYLRGISYTTEYDVEVKCPECDRKFATTIDLNDLYVDPCPEDFGPGDLAGELPDTGVPFSFRLSRGNDEQKIQDYRDRKMKFDTGGRADDTLLYRTAMLLEELGGLDNQTQIKNILRELPIGDVAHLRNVVTTPPFGIDTSVEIYCPGCTREFEVDLPLEADFFFPRAQRTSPKKSITQRRVNES